MTEVASVVFCLLGPGSNIDDDLDVAHREDLTRSLLGELNRISTLEKEDLGRAVGRAEGHAQVGQREDRERG